MLLGGPPDCPVLPDFPFEAHPIFTPTSNEDRPVCLGVLEKSSPPWPLLRHPCTLLCDMASFRNYELTEGYDPLAAAWAKSDEGQAAIASIGGTSWNELSSSDRGERAPVRLNIRRILKTATAKPCAEGDRVVEISRLP